MKRFLAVLMLLIVLGFFFTTHSGFNRGSGFGTTPFHHSSVRISGTQFFQPVSNSFFFFQPRVSSMRSTFVTWSWP